MIIDNTYFINDIFIPHAKPSVTDSVTGVAEAMISYIDMYEKEALIKCFGYQMYLELLSNIDITKVNLIKNGADEKWDHLVNGNDYIDSAGKAKSWLGLRQFKDEPKIRVSLLAYYVYYNYNKSNDLDSTTAGDVRHNAENSTVMPRTPKVISAMRKFVKMVRGEKVTPRFIESSFGLGADWHNSSNSQETNLYEFIKDNGTFDKFVPGDFVAPNQFGI